jgi:phosphopantothenoylcysteine decarboxylase/phosphopantothenate--cysteine ligase
MARKQTKALDGYEVLLCVTGGIACYKCADLASRLIQAGAGVTVAMTEAAVRFVQPLTFQTLSRRQVYTSLWQSTEHYESHHVSLTDRADVMIIAPATANIIAKIACGIADELVSCLALAAAEACPILLAPAMNARMWEARPTQDNVKRLKSWGMHVVGPGKGFLACRTEGPGRMAEPDDILKGATTLLKKHPPKSRKR